MDDPLRLWQSGFLGVDFFFVLSGFLITTLLLREEDRNGNFSVKGFYWRRCLRIIPVYFLVVSTLGFYYIGIEGQTEYLGILPFYYLFLSNFLASDIPMLGPTWSLSVEEQFYLVWPLLLLFAPRKYILHILAGLITLNVLAVTGALGSIGIKPLEFPPLVIEMFTATYAPLFIGSGLAIFLHNKAGFETLRQIFGQKYSAPLMFLLLLAVVNYRPPDVTGWPNLVIHFTMAACLASIVIREDHALRSVFAFRPIARVGQISYGIYLYHLIGLHIVVVGLSKVGWQGSWSIFVLYSLVSFVIAELSFRYYETPFLNLRHRRKPMRLAK